MIIKLVMKWWLSGVPEHPIYALVLILYVMLLFYKRIIVHEWYSSSFSRIHPFGQCITKFNHIIFNSGSTTNKKFYLLMVTILSFGSIVTKMRIKCIFVWQYKVLNLKLGVFVIINSLMSLVFNIITMLIPRIMHLVQRKLRHLRMYAF